MSEQMIKYLYSQSLQGLSYNEFKNMIDFVYDVGKQDRMISYENVDNNEIFNKTNNKQRRRGAV